MSVTYVLSLLYSKILFYLFLIFLHSFMSTPCFNTQLYCSVLMTFLVCKDIITSWLFHISANDMYTHYPSDICLSYQCIYAYYYYFIVFLSFIFIVPFLIIHPKLTIYLHLLYPLTLDSHFYCHLSV